MTFFMIPSPLSIILAQLGSLPSGLGVMQKKKKRQGVWKPKKNVPPNQMGITPTVLGIIPKKLFFTLKKRQGVWKNCSLFSTIPSY